jgi:methionyl-tRNA formyltransferase
MINQFRLFLVGRKGLDVLKAVAKIYGANSISEVVGARDKGSFDDCFDEIRLFCLDSRIVHQERINYIGVERSSVFSLAVGWRWIIPDVDNLIVLHDSLLPKYRGFAPLVNMLVNGESKIGVTALFASAEYDRGDIIAQASLDVQYPIKISTAIAEVSKLYSQLVIDIFGKVLAGSTLISQPQNEADATYSLWLNEEDYRIHWNWSAQKIKRFVDAVGFPYGRAETILNGNVIKVDDVELVDDVEIEDRERHLGKVIFMQAGQPVIVCRSGLIKLTKIDVGCPDKTNLSFRSRFK